MASEATSATHHRDEDDEFYNKPFCFSLLTVFLVYLVFFIFLDLPRSNAKFTIQSIKVSSNSSTTWHVDFLVKNPISRYIIYYESDETSVRLGDLNAAVLSTFYEPKSPSHTAFSVDFVAEVNPNDVNFKQLDIKLRAMHKLYGDVYGDAGHFNINCHNLNRNHENVDKIQCHSPFQNCLL